MQYFFGLLSHWKCVQHEAAASALQPSVITDAVLLKRAIKHLKINTWHTPDTVQHWLSSDNIDASSHCYLNEDDE